MPNRDYYKILGLQRGAGVDLIKRRFRQLAFKYHPDRNPGKPEYEERFKLVAEAYQVLTDRDLRRIYQGHGYGGLKKNGYTGFRTTEDVYRAFSSQLLGFLGLSSHQATRGPLPGADICIQLEISPEEASRGTRKTVLLSRMEVCTLCGGTGNRRSSELHTCPSCAGNGKLVHTASVFAALEVCPVCKGDRRVALISCEKCNGGGRFQVRRTLEIEISPGLGHGSRIKFARQGDGGEFGGLAGDLYIVLLVRHGEE
ncbi:MAG: J domain-containing protein [Deltaproteobacteria bacterium]|nr:J domain-containing protein [Deltaproteobacteria bacterium]MBW2072700.1 J domain-containing protein [Deltaproteobacteria bacterium]